VECQIGQREQASRPITFPCILAGFLPSFRTLGDPTPSANNLSPCILAGFPGLQARDMRGMKCLSGGFFRNNTNLKIERLEGGLGGATLARPPLAGAPPREGCGGRPEGAVSPRSARRDGALRTPQETVAKVPLQASENAREWHGKGVERCFRAFLQQSPKQPDPRAKRGGHAQKK